MRTVDEVTEPAGFASSAARSAGHHRGRQDETDRIALVSGRRSGGATARAVMSSIMILRHRTASWDCLLGSTSAALSAIRRLP